jgi:phosphate transport system permease protein
MSRIAQIQSAADPGSMAATDRAGAADSISRPPSTAEVVADRVFRSGTRLAAWAAVALVFYVVWNIARQAFPAVHAYGAAFLVGTVWDANKAQFGILPAIVGTLYTSFLGLAIGSAFGIAIAIFLSEGFLASGLDAVLKGLGLADRPGWTALPGWVEDFLKTTVELLAAVPSVVYGLWGIFVVIPLVREPANWLHAHLGWLPFFDTALSGPGILPASLVLAIMVLPTISAVSRDALVEVPPKLREAAFGLGATRWEVILAVIVPTASTGILGAVILGFGRALGETMALAMLAGNANVMSWSMFSPANTLAALLANHFPEAGAVEVGALMYAALVLLAITLVVNVVGTAIVQRADAALKGLL